MTIGPELLLAFLILALYVNDSAALVHSNEALLQVGLRGRWVAKFGTREFTLMRKEVVVPGLLQPHAAIFRLTWSMATHPGPDPGWESYLANIRFFQLASPLLFLTVLVLLPLALIGRWGDSALLTIILLIYVQIAILLFVLWWSRTQLALSNKALLGLCLELLLCPPVAPNLPRKLCLRRDVSEDFAAACHRLLSSGGLSYATSEMVRRIDDQLAWEDEDSGRHKALKQRRANLV